jgi:hypothetical protein
LKRILIAISILVLLSLTIAVVPVMAENPKKIPVTFTRLGGSASLGDNHWYTDGDIYHIRDGTVAYSTYKVIGDGISYSGSSHSTFNANLNLKTSRGTQIYHITIDFTDGSFEGAVNFIGTFSVSQTTGLMRPIDAHFKGVFHGTEDYVGQTLVLEYDVVNGVSPSPLVGYLLIP